MKSETQPNLSAQIRNILPTYIGDTYKTFVDFMVTADESEERFGFSSDILQNLIQYEDFDTYKKGIIESTTLDEQVTLEDTEITLTSSYGFPEKDGIVLINEEIVLYRRVEGNKLVGCQRGSSGTTQLTTYTIPGTYSKTAPQEHSKGDMVQNLSVLFLVSMLETIHKSFFSDVSSDNIDPKVNRTSLLQNIKDFFQAKGTALGIKALFKMLFGENDVQVYYPGDQMIKPSVSTWTENMMIRTVPIPDEVAQTETLERHVTPDVLINQMLQVKSYNDNNIYGQAFVDYVSSYAFEEEIQYELWLNKSNFAGEIPANPKTNLTRDLRIDFTGDANNIDVNTITVESTLGFPDSGVLFIDKEAIFYTDRSFNQFFNCKRAHLGVARAHTSGTLVYGPYYVEAKAVIDDVTYVSRSWPLGLVESVRIDDPGLLHEMTDEVFVNGPGEIDNRDYVMKSILENFDDDLASQANTTDIGYIENITYGVSGVYFDEVNAYVSSSNLPQLTIGPFSSDNSVGSELKPIQALHIIPRRETIQENKLTVDKGNSTIAAWVDGTVAFSEVSPEKVIQGTIARFDVKATGEGYVNPTVIITPNNSTAEAVVEYGRIVDVVSTMSGSYTDDPTIRISSGEDATFVLDYDKYGRITTILITNPGRFYIDVPFLQIIDTTNRGRGALIRCEVSGGAITGTEILNPGIDYNPNTTSVRVVPVGAGAEVTATTQYYRLNRYEQVLNNSAWSYDRNGGFLWENDEGVRSRYGFITGPKELMRQLGDGDENKHSPLLGWAFDGNPIYGPYGFENGVDDSSGIARLNSGYKRLPNRDTIIASGGDLDNPEIGFQPPSEAEYPMGTFVEDYYYNPDAVQEFILNTEIDEDIQTESRLDIAATIGGDAAETIILDIYNGRVCNTPEFPVQYYPDGVYCYFVAFNQSNEPQFPYIIGKTFKNRPITQRITLRTNEEIQPIIESRSHIYDPESYESPTLVFDYDKIERYRNLYLEATNAEVELRIGSVSTGSISEVIVEDGTPDTSKVGDILYFDDTDTGGTGAEAKVEFVKGEDIDYSYGTLVQTRTISHRIIIDVSNTIQESYVFVEGSFIETTSGSQARVISYEPLAFKLEVEVTTPNLPIINDCFYDNRGTRICLKGEASEVVGAQLALTSNTDTIGNEIITGFTDPPSRPDGTTLQSGDLWWSPQNGRFYVYYVEAGQPGNWVTTQPLSMRPFNGALDEAIGTDFPSTPATFHEAINNTITISTQAPDERPDGSPNVLGDLWWSPHTGIIYIWYSDYLSYAFDYYQNNGSLPDSIPPELTAQWVSSDPAGTIPLRDTALDLLYPIDSLATRAGSIYSADITCTVGEAAPAGAPVGALWWCTANGKMFIKYDDGDTTQWVITNPHGSLTSEIGSLDEIVTGPDGNGGGGSGGGGGIIDGQAEGKDKDIIWFDNLTHFEPFDVIEIQTGTPGFDEANEKCLIEHKGIPHSAKLIRGYDGDAVIEIPNRSLTTNLSRAIYTVETVTPHKLRVGDEVFISGSAYDEVNGRHTLITAGTVEGAVLQAVIDPTLQTVIRVDIISPGKRYKSNFYVQFTGGGGTGALAYATVTPFVGGEGGQVTNVEVINGGVNYTEAPTPLLGGDVPDTSFSFYLTQTYPLERTLTYAAKGNNVENFAAILRITSPGIGYERLPVPVGLVKFEQHQAELKINLIGDSIGGVNILNGGTRYKQPRVIFEDLSGSGSGAVAIAQVTDETITNIVVVRGGSGYIEPVIHLVERGGAYTVLTDDIGKINSIDVIQPGRKISADRCRKPEIQVETKLIVSFQPGSVNDFFDIGSSVYQGFVGNKFCQGIVSAWDPDLNQVSIIRLEGVIYEDAPLYDGNGTVATVRLTGQADCAVVVGGTSSAEGSFIDDTSMISNSFAHIQDSFYYQYFSYVIASPLQRTEYDTFVNEIIHPAGFVLFSDFEVNTNLVLDKIELEDVQLSYTDDSPTVPTLVLAAPIIDETPTPAPSPQSTPTPSPAPAPTPEPEPAPTPDPDPYTPPTPTPDPDPYTPPTPPSGGGYGGYGY